MQCFGTGDSLAGRTKQTMGHHHHDLFILNAGLVALLLTCSSFSSFATESAEDHEFSSVTGPTRRRTHRLRNVCFFARHWLNNVASFLLFSWCLSHPLHASRYFVVCTLYEKKMMNCFVDISRWFCSIGDTPRDR